MSRYQPELVKVRKGIETSAQANVDHLYKILTVEDKRSPMEARKILESDLGDKYKLSTIVACLPDECKDKVKAVAGKIGAKVTNTNASAGQVTVTTEADGLRPTENTDSGTPDTERMPDQGIIPEGVDDSNIKYWGPAEERQPSVEMLEMKKEMDTVKNQMEELRKNAMTFKDGYDRLNTMVQEKDKKIAKLTNDVAIIDQERVKLQALAKKGEAMQSWNPEPEQKWDISGGPEPDGTDDFFEQRISLGRVLQHLRFVKATYGNAPILVDARIMVVKKPTIPPKS